MQQRHPDAPIDPTRRRPATRPSRAIRRPGRPVWTSIALATALLVGGCWGGGDDDDDDSPVDSSLGNLEGSTRDVEVELREGTNMAASPSPDGQRIVFSAQGALWVIPIEGGTATRITAWDVEPTAPVWSPDGRLIAFQNYTREGNYHIWTVEPDGSNPRELTTGPYDDREPAWTPDGKAVVFSSDRSNDVQYKIWSVALDGGALVQHTAGPGAESNPAISPDGRRLAFVDTGIVYTAAVGTRVTERTEVGPGTAPAWTEDGEDLVYQTAEKTLRVGGADDVAAGEDIFSFPVRWLPDGRFLYTADGKLRTRAADGSGRADIPFTATLKVRRPVMEKVKDRQFDVTGARPVMGVSAPALSPDGESVAFVALNDVWVMKIGEAPVRLTDDTDRDGNPQWTKDGSAVYFSTERGNAGSLAVDRIEVATKARTRLAAIEAKSMVTPKLSPTEDRIAYTTGAGQLELWDIGAGTSTVVLPQVSSQVSTPQWTPDGNRIVLVDNERMNNRFREGYNKLRVIEVASRTATFHAVADIPRQISDREEGAAVLSPDGRQVAFVMDSVLHVMPMNADGSPAGAPKAITTEVADLPSWAGDSKTLLYKSADKLRLIQSDGSGVQEVPLELTWRAARGEGTTIVRAGRLWDGINEIVKTDVDIVIEGHRIKEIRAHRPTAEEEADRYIDASTQTVLPGLWDPHIHPLTIYQGGQFGQISALMLAYGVTSTQSVAGPLHQSIEMREALEAGNLIGPRVFVSPPLWEGNRLFYSFARTLRTPEVADLEIEKATALGTDYMKSYVRAPIPIMQKIAQAGLDLGIPTGTHMLSPGTAAGLGGTTHLSATQRMGYGWSKSLNGYTYQDAYDLHAKADFHVVDTLFSSMALVGDDPAVIGDDRYDLLVPPNFLAGLAGTPPTTDVQRQTVTRDAAQSFKVQQAGGLLAVGTDSPLVAPGIAVHMNLRGSGLVMSNHQALQNVTINAARMSYVDKDLGSVEAGKLADLTIVEGNPLDDLKDAANVVISMKNGVAYTQEEILAPFRTAEAVAQRKSAIRAYALRCLLRRGDAGSCDAGGGMHAH